MMSEQNHRRMSGYFSGRTGQTLRRAKGVIALSAAVAAGAFWAGNARADIYGNNGGINLNLPGSWTDETSPATDTAPPGASDIARWDSLSPGGSFNLGTGTTWLGISIANPTAAVTIGSAADITAGGALTIGASGINMTAATQSLTLVDNATLGAAQNWNVATGQTLTHSGTLNTNGVGLVLAGAGNITSNGVISGGGSLTMSGTGTLSLTKGNTYSGGTTINSGTVSLTTYTSAGTGTITLAGGTLAVNGTTSSNTLSNNLVAPAGDSAIISLPNTQNTGGSGTVTGSGTITIAINGSTNDLAINNRVEFQNFTGVLSLGSSTGYIREASGSAGPYIGGILDLGTSTGYFNSKTGGTVVLGGLESSSSATVLYGATTANDTSTFSIGSLNASTVFAGSIQNGTVSGATSSLTLTGGTLALTGTNTYTGVTTISSPATLQVGNGGTTGSISGGNVTNNSVLAFNPGSAGSFTIPNVISGSGVVNHIGPGVTSLTGANTYSGGTTINSGTLQADNATNSLGAGAVAVNGTGALGGIGMVNGAVTINSAGILSPGDVGINHGLGTGVGTLSVNSITLASGSVLAYDLGSLGNDLTNVTSSGGLNVNGGGIDLYQAGTTSGVITNGTYNIFNVSGGYSNSVSNLLTVLNPQPNLTYTWGTSGTLITLTIGGGATPTNWNSSTGGSWASATNWTAGVPNAQFAIASFGTVPGVTSPSTVTLDGNKTVGVLNFNNSVGNGSVPPTTYTIAQGTGGTLIVDNGTNPASISDLNGTQLISTPVQLNSSTGISVSNAADTLTLSNAITGTGGLSTAGAGTVVLGGVNSFGGNVAVGAGTLILSGNNSAVLGSTTISSGAALQVGVGGSTGSLPNGAVANAGTLTFNVASGTTVVSGTVSGVGNLIQSGTGVTALNGSNSYSGATTINAGTLQLGTPTALGSGTLTINAGLLDLNGYNTSVGSLTGAGQINDVAGAGTPTLTVGNANSTTFSGSINNTTGSVSLLKVGAGTLTLSGPSNYTGNTNISAGVIKVATGGSLNPTGIISDVVTNGLVLGNGVNIGNPIVFSGGTNEFVNVSDTNAAATLSGPVSLLSTSSQLRLGITGTGASLTVTGAESAGTAAIGILDRGNLIFAGTGSFNVGSGGLLVSRAGATNVTLMNNASITSGFTTSVGQGQAGAGNFVLQLQDNASFATASTFDLQAINVGSSTATYNIAGGTFAAGAFIKTYNDSSHTATLNLNGGVLAALNSSGAFLPAFTGLTANVGTNGALINDNGFAITIAAPLVSNATPDGGLTKLGVGTTTLSGSNTYTGGTNVSAGTLSFSTTGALPLFSKLNVAANATAMAGRNTSTVKTTLFASSLSIAGVSNAWTGKLDLSNNDLDVQNASLATLNNQVKQGYNNGTWTSTGGIVSSAAAADSTHLTALGVIQNSMNGSPSGTVLYSSFDGQSSSNTDVIAKYTYYGDANLDGKVDGSDYSRIDAAYLANKTSPGSMTGWFNGDFNYDGVIDGSDYTLMDNAFNMQGAQITSELASPSAVATAQIAAVSAVPEPTSLGLLAIGVTGLLGRRKRMV